MALNTGKSARQLAILGAALVLIGLLTGIVSGQMANPRMGLSSHLAGMMGGTLLLALSAIWPMVRLSPRAEAWAVGLLGFGFTANWLATLLAAIWGAGSETMPIAGAGHSAAPWQEGLVAALLIALSLATIAGVALVLLGLIKGRQTAA
jgi:hydroxylaminobenzene mutase